MNTGYLRLNTSTLQTLTRAFEDHPHGDLEETLRRICTEYPQLRVRTDTRRAKLQEKDAQRLKSVVDKQVPTLDRRATRNAVFLPPFPLSSDIALSIDSPLDSRVLSSLDVNIQQYTNLEVTESLLRTLHSREPLSTNGRRMIVPLDENIVVKVGHNIDTDELGLLHFLENRVPAIVAPRALGFMTIGTVSCMFMTRLPGATLQERWANMNLEEKLHVRALLDTMLSDLRKVSLPLGSPMGSVSGRHACKDCRRYIRVSEEPIHDESQFNEFLVRSERSRAAAGYRSWIVSMMHQDHRILLTHGDLHPGNIIVDLDKQGCMTVALIDWEMGGFYPEYWEMLKAMNTRAITDPSDWWDYLPPCILGYNQEIAVDRMIENTLLG